MKRTERKWCTHRDGRRAPGIALGIILSAALAVTMIPAMAALDGPAFAAEKGKQIRQDAFAFPDGKALKALEKEAETYPDAFDLRNVDMNGDGEGDTSFITPVKVQNPYGTCWGFAAIAAAESGLLSSGLAGKDGYDVNTLDLSEKQLAYFVNTYIDDPDDSQYWEGTHFRDVSKADEATSAYKYDTGGFTYMATALLASGVGPVQEHPESTTDPLAYKGARGERSLWNVATKYLQDGTPDPGSYQRKPVWYSDQDDWSIPDEYRYMQQYSMKDSIVLPSPAGYPDDVHYQFQPEGVSAIKQQMYDHHRAVCVLFCAESYLPGQDTSGKKYMSEHWAHYTNVPQNTNHSVTIVGWDDNYPKENFDSSTATGGTAQPEGDGAFLIKNSWGSELNAFPNNGYRHWGLLEGLDGVPYDEDAQAVSDRATGYFWISYYDESLDDPETFVFDKSNWDSPNYDIEQTDLMYPTYCLYTYADGVKMANVFEADTTSKLNEIGALTTTPGTDLSYEVYLLGEAYRDPQDGILIASGTEHFDYGGYHKISLDTPKILAKGQQYSVVVRENSEWGDHVSYAASINYEGMDLYSVGVINKGESFYYAGGQWADLSEKSTRKNLTKDYAAYNLELDNFPIKSYLEAIPDPADPAEDFTGYLTVNNWQESNPGTFTLQIGETKTLTAEFRGITKDMPDSWNPAVTWTSEDVAVSTVTPKAPDLSRADITGIAPGKTDLVVDAGDYGVRIISIIVQKPEAANNTLSVKGKTASVKYSKLKKNAQRLAVSKVIKFVDKGEGKLSYKKTSGNKKIIVNKKTGQVTVKKGLKKGTYTVKISVTAAGNADYKPGTQTVKAKIQVK